MTGIKREKISASEAQHENKKWQRKSWHRYWNGVETNNNAKVQIRWVRKGIISTTRPRHTNYYHSDGPHLLTASKCIISNNMVMRQTNNASHVRQLWRVIVSSSTEPQGVPRHSKEECQWGQHPEPIEHSNGITNIQHSCADIITAYKSLQWKGSHAKIQSNTCGWWCNR